MVDIVDIKTRSRMMSGIRGKNTKPELLIRKALFARGFRYRLHDRCLAGKPDLMFSRYRAVIFVHGCFWHGHDCHLFRWPSSNADFWKTKITRNREVDERNIRTLQREGWRILTIWECALKGRTRLPIDPVISNAATWIKSGSADFEIRGLETPDGENIIATQPVSRQH